ncbi:AAA family ATPase [Capnocytophaga canimorsus]|uniref:AAA family ATPase n=1 Tax=Capnocytophaga canimorsus TaxID=28188 RepID=UPI000F50D163|nr:AAA family ATPase [Capnocytophaga canimorsus]AYW35898.1 ATP-binding protein [Capnocytophaga canimorsus]
MRRQINPNRARHRIDSTDLEDERNFPNFLKSIEFESFRQIKDLSIEFRHPISVISGVNRTGKSTVLMAIACSHFNFNKRNLQNGNLERHTWSDLMRFTNGDIQTEDWTYYITYKIGRKSERKRGQRKISTKKWNGIGKKESQFKDRHVVFIDLDRGLPARNFSKTIFYRSKNSAGVQISQDKADIIKEYISYILEEDFELNKLSSYQDKDIFKYHNTNTYSSYNAATGEEVLAKIIIDTVEAQNGSLILIDEIEVGLHPKVQRRLVDILYNIALKDKKQFIITSHSQTILSSLPNKSRIFLEKDYNNNYKCIQDISVNGALSKMDSLSYPLFDLYCEDDIAKKIIKKVLDYLKNEKKISNIFDLVNIIVSGSADKTYSFFQMHKETYPSKKIKTGYVCILDGDMRNNTNYSQQDNEELYFLYSDKNLEYFLVEMFLNNNPNTSLQYHLQNSDNHCLFEKMVELQQGSNKDEAFELCWKEFENTDEGQKHIRELGDFIEKMIDKFSKEL